MFGCLSVVFKAVEFLGVAGASAGRNPLVAELISSAGFSEEHPSGATIVVKQAALRANPLAE